ADFVGNVLDTDPIGRVLGSISYLDSYFSGARQTDPVIAARLNGGFGIVFTNEQHANGTADSNGPNITYRPVSSTGALGTPLAIGDFDDGLGFDALSHPNIATLSTGRQILVFERTITVSDHDIYF